MKARISSDPNLHNQKEIVVVPLQAQMTESKMLFEFSKVLKTIQLLALHYHLVTLLLSIISYYLSALLSY